MLIIRIPKPENLQVLFANATADAKKHNISWRGDMQHGRGSHRGFEGSYVVDETHITITVSKKPLWVSQSMIEKEIKKYLAQAVDYQS
jgi:hypothetical protein